MKSLVQNRKNLMLATLLATSFGLNAQIESTHTDVKYGYTTVVYKDKAATDTDVLNALENSVGMGDVVRVTVAPPKPAPVPKVDKSKGEDTWLNPSAKPAAGTLTASASAMPVSNVVMATAAPLSGTASVAALNAAPVAAKPVAKKAAAAPSTVSAAPAGNFVMANIEAKETTAAAPATARVARSAESIKAAKSANKSLKKGKGNHKMKNRKKGKQRYKCPKF